jgi:hypothetical protein
MVGSESTVLGDSVVVLSVVGGGGNVATPSGSTRLWGNGKERVTNAVVSTGALLTVKPMTTKTMKILMIFLKELVTSNTGKKERDCNSFLCSH